MYRPTGKSLVSRGILALKKGISKATNGILDKIKLGAGGGTYTKSLKLLYKIIGSKKYSFSKEYEVIGIKKIVYSNLINIKANKILDFSYVKKIKGSKLTLFFCHHKLIGSKKLEFNSLSYIYGRVKQYININSSVFGIKKNKFVYSLNICANKCFKMEVKSEIVGSFLYTLNKSFIIKGKSDYLKLLIITDVI